MDDSFRAPLVVAEVMVLALILAFVDHNLLRVSLGLVVAILLARAALAREESFAPALPGGPHERRRDHVFRHWVSALLKKIRELHAVCDSVSGGGVNVAAGELRIHQLEAEIESLVQRVTDTARPDVIGEGRGGDAAERRNPEVYGESVSSD